MAYESSLGIKMSKLYDNGQTAEPLCGFVCSSIKRVSSRQERCSENLGRTML